MDLSGGMIVVETNDLVRDLPNSVLGEIVGKCEEERGKLGARRIPFSDEQRLVLQQAYSENWYISGGKELVPFTQLVKVRMGKLVLALPSIRFS